MDKLSKDKLLYFKTKKHLTNAKIAALTGLPISNVDKIFSGLNKNPTLGTINKIAFILNCSLDDLIDYDEEPLSGFYCEKQVMQIAQELQKSKELKNLFEITKGLSDEDISVLISLVKRFKTVSGQNF